MKIIWLSDLHFTTTDSVLGHDPRIRLNAAISLINTDHADADFCVISGDLVNRGTIRDYAELAAMLDRLAVPLLPMVGNHDDRALLRQTLPVPTDAMSGFLQYAVTTDSNLVLCLDTQKAGSDAGEFCQARLDWLDTILTSNKHKSAWVFMHHPPMPLGLPMQDQDRMDDGERFLDLLQRHDNIGQLFIGHVHRPITGMIRSIPFATMRSVLYQAPPPTPPWDWSNFAPAQEAPELGVIDITKGSAILQYLQICPFETGYLK